MALGAVIGRSGTRVVFLIVNFDLSHTFVGIIGRGSSSDYKVTQDRAFRPVVVNMIVTAYLLPYPVCPFRFPNFVEILLFYVSKSVSWVAERPSFIVPHTEVSVGPAGVYFSVRT